MQERGKISSMDLKAYMSNLRKSPKLTEEMLELVESDLNYGLTIPETEEYTGKKYDYTQMKVYSVCLRNGYSKEVRDVIAKEGVTGEQMAVVLEFYEKGVPLPTIEEIMGDNGQTAYVMKKLFQNVLDKLRETKNVSDTEEAYAKELLGQIKGIVEKITFQENRYDALNETLKELKTAGQDAKIQNNLLAQMAEKDGLLEKQQNEINEARVTIARLRNEMDGLRKEKDTVKNRAEEMEAQKKNMQSVQESKKQAGIFTLQAETAGKAVQKMETPYPTYPGIEYRTAVVDQSGNILSLVPVERKEEQKENFALTALFSRVFLKRKIDIVKLVAEKDLEPKQLVQIKNGIEKGLSEKQLLVLINNSIPAERMEEIIEIAVFENKMKKEG
jgi:hypothetical protein